MRAQGLLVSVFLGFLGFLVLALAPLAGCDWRTFDDIKARTPVLSVAEPNNFGVNGDFGRVVLPLASPEAGATGGRFLVSAGGTAAIGLTAVDAAGHPAGRAHSDPDFGAGDKIFPITSLAEVAGTPKVLLGSPQGGTTGRGAVYVMTLGTNIDSVIFDEPPAEDHFGMAVGSGALGGGAEPDFVVLSASALSVYLDGDSSKREVSPMPPADCPLVLAPSLAMRTLKNRALVVADLTGAGTSQLVVGTPTDTGMGAVAVFTVAPATGVATCAFAIRGASPRFGQALARGDFDADGDLDLLVGAPPEGAFWLPGPLTAASVPLPVTLTKGASNVQLGAAVGAGNVDGKAGDEAFVGDPDAKVGDKAQAGQVHVVGGATLDDELFVVRRHTPGTGDAYGVQVAALPFCKSGCGKAGAVTQDLLLVGSAAHVFTYFVLDANDKDPRTP